MLNQVNIEAHRKLDAWLSSRNESERFFIQFNDEDHYENDNSYWNSFGVALGRQASLDVIMSTSSFLVEEFITRPVRFYIPNTSKEINLTIDFDNLKENQKNLPKLFEWPNLIQSASPLNLNRHAVLKKIHDKGKYENKKPADLKTGDILISLGTPGAFIQLVKQTAGDYRWDYSLMSPTGEEKLGYDAYFGYEYKVLKIDTPLIEEQVVDNTINHKAEQKIAEWFIQHKLLDKPNVVNVYLNEERKQNLHGGYWTSMSVGIPEEFNLSKLICVSALPKTNSPDYWPGAGNINIRLTDENEKITSEPIEISIDGIRSCSLRSIPSIVREIQNKEMKMAENKISTDKKSSHTAIAKSAAKEGAGFVFEGIKNRAVHQGGTVMIDSLVNMIPIKGVKEAMENENIKVATQGSIAFIFKMMADQGAIPASAKPYVLAFCNRQIKASGYKLSEPVLNQAGPAFSLLIDQLVAAGKSMMSPEELAEIEKMEGEIHGSKVRVSLPDDDEKEEEKAVTVEKKAATA